MKPKVSEVGGFDTTDPYKRQSSSKSARSLKWGMHALFKMWQG
jgi:hypothetical protein